MMNLVEMKNQLMNKVMLPHYNSEREYEAVNYDGRGVRENKIYFDLMEVNIIFGRKEGELRKAKRQLEKNPNSFELAKEVRRLEAFLRRAESFRNDLDEEGALTVRADDISLTEGGRAYLTRDNFPFSLDEFLMALKKKRPVAVQLEDDLMMTFKAETTWYKLKFNTGLEMLTWATEHILDYGVLSILPLGETLFVELYNATATLYNNVKNNEKDSDLMQMYYALRNTTWYVKQKAGLATGKEFLGIKKLEKDQLDKLKNANSLEEFKQAERQREVEEIAKFRKEKQAFLDLVGADGVEKLNDCVLKLSNELVQTGVLGNSTNVIETAIYVMGRACKGNMSDALNYLSTTPAQKMKVKAEVDKLVVRYNKNKEVFRVKKILMERGKSEQEAYKIAVIAVQNNSVKTILAFTPAC